MREALAVERQPGPFPYQPCTGSAKECYGKQTRTAGRHAERHRQRFPYEPRVIGGKLMMPADLQAIHR